MTSFLLNHLKEVKKLFVKAKKWLSWLLAVTIIAGLIPFSSLPAFAASDNQSLEDAMNTISNKQAITVVLTGKSIAGVVKLSDIKAHFPRVARVNLSNNFITKIEMDDPSVNVVNSDNNLLTGQRTLNFADTSPIQRLKYNATDINVYDLFAGVQHQGKGVTLQDLITNKAVESITYEFETNGAATERTVNDGNWNSANITAAEVANMADSSVLKLKVKFAGDTAPTETVTRVVRVRDAVINVTGFPATMYAGISVAKVTIEKKGPNGEDLQFSALTDVTIDPNNLLSPNINISGFALTADGKIEGNIKFTSPYSGNVDFKLNSNNFIKSVPVNVVTANFDAFRIIEKDSTSATTGQTVTSNITNPATPVNAPKMFLLKGTAVSSFNSAKFDTNKATLAPGKYYVEVREGGNWRKLRSEETSLIHVSPSSADFSEGWGDDNGDAYLTVSSTFDATLQPTSKVELQLGTNNAVINLTFFPLEELQPEGFYIYSFAPNASQAAMDQAIDEAASPYYVPNTPGTLQDAIKIANPFTLKEGDSRIFLPVAKYMVNGQEKRRFVPGSTVQKTWYQRERTQSAFNFNNTFKDIEANPLFSYKLDSDGYPTTSGTTETYKGAPIKAKTVASPYGQALLLEATSMTGVNPKNKFANVVLAMAGANNPIGFWFQVNWVPKKVVDYVLVEKAYVLPANPDLKSDDPLSPPPAPPQTFKQQLEAELAKVDPNAAIINPVTLKLDAVQKISLPIGTDKGLKLLAIYDNGRVEEVEDANQNTTLEGIASTNFEAGDITVESSTDPLDPSSVLRAFATENGGFEDKGTYFTDGKVGRAAKLKVNNFAEDIAELTLAKSQIKEFAFLANDELRLLVNADDPRVTGEISKGKWHGQFDKLGLGSDSGTDPVVVNQGNASYNDKLVSKVYLIPIYTNKDLTVKKVLDVDTLDNLAPAKTDLLRKFAWVSNDWASEVDKAVVASATAGQSVFKVTTNDDSSKMGAVGTTPLNVKFTLDSTAQRLNGHDITFSGTDREKEIPFKLEAPIYDRIGAVGEIIKAPNAGKKNKK